MGMIDTSMEDLEAKLNALNTADGTAPEGGVPADGAQEGQEAVPQKFQPKALANDAPAAEAAEEDAEDYFGIDVEGVDYKVPQVDREAVTSVREKAANGEELTDYDKAVVAQGEFNEELAKYGLDWNAITVEYHKEGGSLTADTLGKLCEVFPKALVMQYMAGVDASHRQFLESRQLRSVAAEQAEAAKQREAEELGKLSFTIANEAAGGEDKFKAISSWASSNLPKDELDAINEVINNLDLRRKGDQYALRSLITNLAAKHKAAVGSPSTGVLPQARASGAAEDGPMTAAQYTAAVRDPRYSKDKGWAAAVDRRRLAGINKGL